MTHEFKFDNELAIIYSVFHVSMLKECIGDPISIHPLERKVVKEDLDYEEVSYEIIERQVMKLRNKEVVSIEVLWKNHLVEGTT